MVREDLVTSAVDFLRDPSVAAAAVDKKVAFLQSKNLTQEEIDVALSRASDPSTVSTTTTTTASSTPPSTAYGPYARAPLPPPGYRPYPGYWQPPPPEVPKRDWRDWFIMATVMGGVGYGLYFTAKRYIIPLIAPPTPPQLEQDKASIGTSFEKAFALLDQLSTDTATLKAAEESRTARLDSALAEVEAVVQSLKDGERKREDDARRNADEIRGLRELIPRALDGQKEGTEERLRELGTELRSLKTLVGNRMGGGPTPGAVQKPAASGSSASGSSSSLPGVNCASASAPASTTSSAPVVVNDNPQAVNGTSDGPVGAASTTNTVGTSTAAPDRSQSATPSFAGRFGSGRGGASIPAWQLAAGKKSQESLNGEKKDTPTDETAAEASAS